MESNAIVIDGPSSLSDRPPLKPPAVSVIIPTKNRPSDLLATCRSVFAQTVPPQQLIIVDQSQTAESEEKIRKAHSEAASRDIIELLYILDGEIAGLTLARNRAMQVASGDIWLFLDDDVVLEPDFIDQILAVYRVHPEAVGVSGVVTNYNRPHWSYRLWSSLFLLGPLNDDRQPVYWKATEAKGGEPVRVTRLGGGLMSFRADALGGTQFDDNLRGVADGEDVDFCARLGPTALLMIAPSARLLHNQSPSGRERGHWVRRHARGVTYLYSRNWRTGIKNRICFAWLNVGYALVTTLASIRRASLEPWKGLLEGLRDGLDAASTKSK